MDKNRIFTQWKEHRRQIPVPEDFSAHIMAKIENMAPKGDCKASPVPTDAGSGLMQWCTAAGLVILGLFRVVFILANLLRANVLMPY